MRQIKLRAWDIHGKKWFDFENLILVFDGDSWIISDGVDPLYEIENFILVQSTGLHDKNGKEIWSGDIYFDGFVLKKHRYIVWYEDGFWSVRHCRDAHWRPVWHRIEIIGNIYENPELLESNRTKTKE